MLLETYLKFVMEFLFLTFFIGRWSVCQWSVHLIVGWLVSGRWLVVGWWFDSLFNIELERSSFWIVFCRRDVLKILRKPLMNENFKDSYVDRTLLDGCF